LSTKQQDRIALVTGANRGIGRETCRQLAESGCTVLLTARDLEKAKAAAAELDGEGVVLRPLQLDVTEDASVESARDWVQKEFGRLDILVNNGAIDYDSEQSVLAADLDRVRRIGETNTLGPWRVVMAMLPLLRESAHARIVNVSSESGSLDSMSGGAPGYSLSKAGLNVVTMMLAATLRPERILVNAVCPGWVRTDMGGPSARRSVTEGASSVVWAATLGDDGPTGGFFRDGKPIEW